MTATLGIVGLPELARVLREAGVEVVEGGRWDARAASPISDQLHRGRRFPVLVESAPIPGLSPWIGRLATLTSVWVVRSGGDDLDLPRASGWFDLPVGVVEILDTIGLDTAGLGSSLQGSEVTAGGRIRLPEDRDDSAARDEDPDPDADGAHAARSSSESSSPAAGPRRSAPVVRPQPLRDPRAARLAASPEEPDRDDGEPDDEPADVRDDGPDDEPGELPDDGPDHEPGEQPDAPAEDREPAEDRQPSSRDPVDPDQEQSAGPARPSPSTSPSASASRAPSAAPSSSRPPPLSPSSAPVGEVDDGGGDRGDDRAATEDREAGNEVGDGGEAVESAADGMTRSTCAHCGEAVYGVAEHHLWWHVDTREAACRTGGTTATPATGPPPPPPAAGTGVGPGPRVLSEDPGTSGAWSRRGAVVFSAAAKGGVGKTTLAMALAAAGAERGLDVVLVDANRGQGDVAHYLRLTGTHLPTVYDAAVTRRPADGLATADLVAQVRQPWLDRIGFALVLGPSSDGQADPDLTTADVYVDVVRHAAGTADLVVVDTQILERVDTSGLIDRLTVPLLEESAWLLAVTDMSSAAVVNTRERLEALHRDGVTAARVLVAPNRVEPDDATDVARLGEVFEGRAQVLPAIASSSEVVQAMNDGNAPVAPPGLRAVVDDVLLRVTGNPAFAPPGDQGGRFRGWFGRRTRRGS